MSEKWRMKGRSYGNCNCAWGCPCQFGSATTHGHCEAISTCIIDEGHFDNTRLDGLNWILLLYWPGEIADGDGTEQAIIDERADAEQREAIRKILHGEDTAPGSTHFSVFASTMSNVLETIYAPIELSIDIEARRAHVEVPGLVESTGSPIIDAFSGEEARSRIHLPNGFEYTYAEMGSGTSKVRAGITLDLSESYGQFNILDMNQDGVIR